MTIQTMKNKMKLLSVIAVSFILTACLGGGGGSSSSTTTTPTPAASTYSISGTTVPGATLTLSGAAMAIKVADASGAYRFTGLANGAYVVTPFLANHTFTPASLAVPVNGVDVTGITFNGIPNPTPTPNPNPTPVVTYSISGTVTGLGAGVTISLSPGGASTLTAADGTYSISGLANGSYVVTPSYPGYSLAPASMTVPVANANVSSVNFLAAANVVPTYSISGNVSGLVSSGVTITLSPGGATTTTDTSGNWTLSGLVNGVYTVTPSLATHTFTPANATATVNGANVTGVNFTEPVPALAVGKLLYPCPQAVCSKNLATGVESVVSGATAVTSGTVVPFRSGTKAAYVGSVFSGGLYFSGIYTLDLLTSVNTLTIGGTGYSLGTSTCSPYPQGSFDLSPLGDFAAIRSTCTNVGSANSMDIFLVQMNGTGNSIRVTNDPDDDSSPVIGGIDAAGVVTVLFVSNKAGVVGIYKQLVNTNPAVVTALVGTQILVTNNVLINGGAGSTGDRVMSVNAAYTHLTFMKAVGGIPHIFVKPLAGGAEVDLGAGANPSWATDGSNKILYTANNALWAINQDGTGKTTVAIPANLDTNGFSATLKDPAFVTFGPAGF